jgi:phage shock protein C
LKEKKRFVRSRSDKIVSGVLGGISQYFGMSSKLLRILFIIALIPTSFMLIIPYTILSCFMPREEVKEMDI